MTTVLWSEIIGLRNRLIHGYFHINLDIVWDTVRNDLPRLILSLELVLSQLDQERPLG